MSFAKAMCLVRISRFASHTFRINRTFSHATAAGDETSIPDFGKAASRIRFSIPEKPHRLPRGEGVGGGPEGRISQLRRSVSALFDEERIELAWEEAVETRLYAERLVQEAIISSDEQDNEALFKLWMESEPGQQIDPGEFNPTILELALFYLKQPRLIEKLFKVFVPRYRLYNRPYTSIHRLPRPHYPSPHAFHVDGFAVLEMHGNPWPSVRAARGEFVEQPFKHKFLINVLLDAARNSSKTKYKPHEPVDSHNVFCTDFPLINDRIQCE